MHLVATNKRCQLKRSEPHTIAQRSDAATRYAHNNSEHRERRSEIEFLVSAHQTETYVDRRHDTTILFTSISCTNATQWLWWIKIICFSNESCTGRRQFWHTFCVWTADGILFNWNWFRLLIIRSIWIVACAERRRMCGLLAWQRIDYVSFNLEY